MVTFRAGENPEGCPSFQSHNRNPLCSQISHWILGLAFAPALLRVAETNWKTRMQKTEGQLLNGAIPATPMKLQRAGAAELPAQQQPCNALNPFMGQNTWRLQPWILLTGLNSALSSREKGRRFSCAALGCAVPGKEGLDLPLFSFPKYLDSFLNLRMPSVLHQTENFAPKV